MCACRIKVQSGKKWEKVVNMFYGQFEHTIDEKNRLMVPRKMRDEAGVKLFIMKGYEGSLSIYKANDFDRLVNEVQQLSFTHRNARDYIRATIGSAMELDVDKQGRIQIPTYFMNKYAISKEVVIIGAGDHFEIWNKDKFNEYESSLDESFENIAESLYQDK